jgi:hypothetical protein
MLAVVVLLPILIIVAACLLERLEARTVAEPAPRIRRPLPAASPAEPAAEPAVPVAPTLALVTGADEGGAGTATAIADRDADAGALRRAS